MPTSARTSLGFFGQFADVGIRAPEQNGLLQQARASVVSPKWLVFCCAQFGLWRGARREHPPQWGCDRRATKPQAKLGATQRAAVLFPPGFVAHSLQIHFGICSSLAPRLDRKTLAAKHQPFRRHNTSVDEASGTDAVGAVISDPRFS